VFSFFLASIDIHDLQIHYHFFTFLCVLASGPPTVTSGPPSAKLFSTLLKPLVMPLPTVATGQLATRAILNTISSFSTKGNFDYDYNVRLRRFRADDRLAASNFYVRVT